MRDLLASPEVVGLALEHHAAMYLQGKLLGGDEGRRLCEAALAWGPSKGFADVRLGFRITAPVVTDLE